MFLTHANHSYMYKPCLELLCIDWKLMYVFVLYYVGTLQEVTVVSGDRVASIPEHLYRYPPDKEIASFIPNGRYIMC